MRARRESLMVRKIHAAKERVKTFMELVLVRRISSVWVPGPACSSPVRSWELAPDHQAVHRRMTPQKTVM